MMTRLRPTLLLTFLILATLGLLAACRGNEPSQFGVDEQAKATCSDECATRGQCGTLDKDTRVVLAMEGGPAVSLQDRFFIDGTLVTVIELSQRELIAARDGVPQSLPATPFPHTFYRVTGEGKTAWVSEWCLARP
ncbi:MAG: hypothetical protein KJ046_00030 [Anaerolineae bacterium]|nr:hypothetical protein [Anaerolineae bacterium]